VTARAGKPIVITTYDAAWPRRFETERDLIFDACGREPFVAIEHVGSTAVPGLAAKPIIDIMPGLRSLGDAPPLIPLLEDIGYQYVPEFEQPNAAGGGMPFRRYFRKDVDGERAFHLHMVATDSEFWRRHLLFRDWLRRHPEHADSYAALKRRIAAEYNAALTPASDINLGYTNRKSEFIESIVARAAAEGVG
jgi:GrpB-like predicted nucleotidyltransferase (UPF0157 family)